MPSILAILMSLFCENNKKTPGVIKVFLYHAELEKNKSNWTDASTIECSFLRK